MKEVAKIRLFYNSSYFFQFFVIWFKFACRMPCLCSNLILILSNWRFNGILNMFVGYSFSLSFHPISNWRYFLHHSLFHILNSSQWSGIFLSKLVNLWTKVIYYFLILTIFVSYFRNYIYCKFVTLWNSMIELYENVS